MRPHFLAVIIIVSGINVSAQTPYPQPPAARPSLSSLEYFIDSDPGFGQGRQIGIPSGTDLDAVSFQADLSTSSKGFHRIYVRSRDANGQWSLCSNLLFDNVVLPPYPAVPPGQPVLVQAEYYIDTDPGTGNGTALALPASADVALAPLVINVSGLPSGIHRLYVRTRNAANEWSLTNFVQFDNTGIVPYPSAPSSAPPLGEMEFYIDTDPGFGNGTPINFTSGSDINNLSIDVSLSGVTPGPHSFYIRSRQNPWSFSAYLPFLYSSTLPVTWLYLKGEIIDHKAVLSWATALEENSEKFVIEYSREGQVFAPLGELPAHNNSNNTNRYTFSHGNPSNGLNFYRIKQIDQDGRHTYSKTIQLLYKPDEKAAIITPNPVSTDLYIIAGKDPLTLVEIFDLQGRSVFSRSLSSGQQVYTVDVSGLLSGMYIIKLFNGKTHNSHKIIKR